MYFLVYNKKLWFFDILLLVFEIFPKEGRNMALEQVFWLVITHYWAHFDEYVAIFLLRRFGEMILPGVSTVPVEYDDAGAKAPAILAQSGDWERIGVVPVGIYGRVSPFDEHPDTENGRKRDESAASLMAKFLGLSEDARVMMLVAYATSIDTKGKALPGSMPAVVKQLNTYHPDDPELVLQWALRGIKAWFESDAGPDFDIDVIAGLLPENEREAWLGFGKAAIDMARVDFQIAIAEIRERGPKRRIRGFGGAKLDLIVMESDNPEVARAALSFSHAHVVVVRKSSGHVQVMTSQKAHLRMTDLARILNVLEQQASGEVLVRDFKELGWEGTIAGGRWCYVKGMEAVLNGSHSAPSVPATRIPLEKILWAVEVALDTGRFFFREDGFQCDGSRCASSPKRPCPWFDFGRTPCATLRYEQKRADGRVDDRFSPLRSLRT